MNFANMQNIYNKMSGATRVHPRVSPYAKCHQIWANGPTFLRVVRQHGCQKMQNDQFQKVCGSDSYLNYLCTLFFIFYEMYIVPCIAPIWSQF